jgi:hypothetical protein
MKNMGRCAVALGVTGILLLAASESRAGQAVCGSTSAGWNVPAGDPVFVSGPGPIYSVLSAMGEYRSHSMLSNGPDGWVTHATSVTPPTNSDVSPYYTPFCSSCGSECWNPIDPGFLTNSMPGLETVNQGAIYSFLYNGSSENFIAYQRSSDYANGGAQANAVSNITFPGPNMAWAGWWSGSNYGTSGDSSQYVWGRTYNGSQIHYGWFQYKNVQGTAQGVPGVNTGVVCSSSLTLWQHDALSGQGVADVLPRTYSNNNANGQAHVYNAAVALWNGVQSECNSSTGWGSGIGGFFTNLGWSALCVGETGYTQGVCGMAADQMVNCFAANNCGNKSSPGSYFQGYSTYNNGNAQWQSAIGGSNTAVGISPDDVGCWNGNGTGAPCTGSGSSIWGWDGSQTVQWNSGGNSYGCWE